jgi:cell division protease FtsH
LPEERQITTTEQIFDEMCAALGGRAAEDLVFGKISTGALSDLEKVTKQAYAMVTVYGLNKRLGNISYYDSRGEQTFTKPYSEETARIIDEEVGKLIESAYERAKNLLDDNQEKLTALADALLTNEVIFKEDVERILGPRPFAPRQESVAPEPVAAVPTTADEPAESVSPEASATEIPSEAGPAAPETPADA